MADVEAVKSRLSNIRTVEPVLGALRTISLASWRAALKQREGLQTYTSQLSRLLPLVVPHLPIKKRGISWPWEESSARSPGEDRPSHGVVLVVGSERGLCGHFNNAVVDYAQRYIADQQAAGAELSLVVLGARVQRLLARGGVQVDRGESMPTTALPHLSLAVNLTRGWLVDYEAGRLDAAVLIYNAYQGVGHYETRAVQLVPPELPPDAGGAVPGMEEESFLIVETDPLSLYTHLVEQWAVAHLYTLLIDSAAAEHATRYQLMEGATQNAERLIDDLTQELQSQRRQAITREMQELAVGAGLLK